MLTEPGSKPAADNSAHAPVHDLEFLLRSAHFLNIRDAMSSLLVSPCWFVGRLTAGAEALRIELLDLPSLTPAWLDAALETAKRARDYQQSYVTSLGRQGSIGAVPVRFKAHCIGIVGLWAPAEVAERTVRATLRLLQEDLSLVADVVSSFDDLEPVNRIWRRLNTSLECDQLLPMVLDETLQVLSLPHGAVLLVDEDGEFVVRCVKGINDKNKFHTVSGLSLRDTRRLTQPHSPVMVLNPSDPLAVWITQQMEPAAAGDATSVVAMPLKQGSNLLGVTLGAGTGMVSFSESSIRMLAVVAEGASATVGNALRYDGERSKSSALYAIHGIHRLMRQCDNLKDLTGGICCQIAQLLRIPRCAILLLNEDRSRLVPRGHYNMRPNELGVVELAVDASPLREVVREQLPLKLNYPAHVPELAAWPREWFPSPFYFAAALVDKDTDGVLVLARDDRPFQASERGLINILIEQSIVAINNAKLLARLHTVTASALRMLARLAEAHDTHKRGHSESVCEMSDKVGQAMGMDEQSREQLRLGALLHDIGHLFSSNETDAQDLPAIAKGLLAEMELEEVVRKMVLHFRERWDGQGYPDHLAGEEIPLGARIIAAVNALLTHIEGRDGTLPLSGEEAMKRVLAQSGTEFDPKVVESLCAVFAQAARESGEESGEEGAALSADHPAS